MCQVLGTRVIGIPICVWEAENKPSKCARCQGDECKGEQQGREEGSRWGKTEGPRVGRGSPERRLQRELASPQGDLAFALGSGEGKAVSARTHPPDSASTPAIPSCLPCIPFHTPGTSASASHLILSACLPSTLLSVSYPFLNKVCQEFPLITPR